MLGKLGRRVPTQANKEIIKGRKNSRAVLYLMQIREPQDSLRKPLLPLNTHTPAQMWTRKRHRTRIPQTR